MVYTGWVGRVAYTTIVGRHVCAEVSLYHGGRYTLRRGVSLPWWEVHSAQRSLLTMVGGVLCAEVSPNHGRRGGLCAELPLNHGRRGGLCAEVPLFSLRLFPGYTSLLPEVIPGLYLPGLFPGYTSGVIPWFIPGLYLRCYSLFKPGLYLPGYTPV